ncbi:hypothetical protein L195_g011409 [Trifolium pratense]|uniref:Uncharacterized protein n=1 Tax=Trifolium pratense TaxID=57577 RepID=A0A2K3PHJ5_TRIPR|nr:hypothetical protein L195_g011409 [Trifolium pratense]
MSTILIFAVTEGSFLDCWAERRDFGATSSWAEFGIGIPTYFNFNGLLFDVGPVLPIRTKIKCSDLSSTDSDIGPTPILQFL